MAVPPCQRPLRLTRFAAAAAAVCAGLCQAAVAAAEATADSGTRQGRMLKELSNGSIVNVTHTKAKSEVEYVCGSYKRPCQPVAAIPNGPNIWMDVEFTYNRDNTYLYKERGYFNNSACVREDPWLVMTYKGTWSGHGLSEYRQDLSLASIDVHSVWMTLLHETVCVLNQYDRSTQCLNTLNALKVLCPCNGWDWSIRDGKESRERNIGMFCRPLEQCPLIHRVYLQKTQYVSFTASREQGCFKRSSSDIVTGWETPETDVITCMDKVEPMVCTVLQATAVRAVGAFWLLFLALCLST